MKNPFDNPVYWLDSRTRVRERRLWVLAAFFLAVTLAISLLLLATLVKPADSPFPVVGIMIAGEAIYSHGALLALLSALGTWTVIAVLGRALAVRGLRREVY